MFSEPLSAGVYHGLFRSVCLLLQVFMTTVFTVYEFSLLPSLISLIWVRTQQNVHQTLNFRTWDSDPLVHQTHLKHHKRIISSWTGSDSNTPCVGKIPAPLFLSLLSSERAVFSNRGEVVPGVNRKGLERSISTLCEDVVWRVLRHASFLLPLKPERSSTVEPGYHWFISAE